MSEDWFTSETVEQRLESLVGRMALEDKINLVSGKLVVDDAGHVPPLPEGLPELLLADGPAGLRIANPEINERRATALPAPIALAATWNPELARHYGNLIGEEAAATGHNVFLGPAVDIARAPLAGRTFESFGEDPLVQARMVVPEVQAIQSHAVLACIKHFLANNQEFKRHMIDVQVDDRTLREIYLPPFAAAIQGAHIGSAMGSYNRINGTYACENEFTLTKLLRDELGFRGFVMSDFRATPSTVRSAQAGLDWELGTNKWGPLLMQAVEAGDVSTELLDEIVCRILRPVLGLGLADHPRRSGSLNLDEHSAQARSIAEQAIVLLKNENSILPFMQNKIRSIAVIGPDADNVSAAGGGSAYVRPAHEVSVLDGIRRRAGESIRVEYAAGTDPLSPAVLLPGLPAIPASCFSKEGLTAKYWSNTDFLGEPFVTRIEPKVELSYGLLDLIMGLDAGSPKLPPKPSTLFGRFSGHFTGLLSIPLSGEYQLSLTSLGTARLYINDQLIIDTSSAVAERTLGNSLASVYSAQVHLEGHEASVRVEYANDFLGELRFNEAMLRLGWRPPAGVISPAMLEAVELAKRSDVAVVVARTYETEEIDRPSLELPNDQDELIQTVAAVNPNTVVVLMNAGPVEVAPWEGNVPAIVEAWYAGQEQGSALARILFGDVNPSGRLPITFPRSLEQTPVATAAQYPGVEDKVYYSEGLFVGYRGYDKLGLEPQYPFGYGLSYTTFAYTNLQLDHELTDGTQKIQVSFEIANTGSRAGVEVAQVYLGLPAVVNAPIKRLVDWARVSLDPGKKTRVTLIIEPDSTEHPLSYWNTETQAWEIAEGSYIFYLGTSVRDIQQTASFKIRKAK